MMRSRRNKNKIFDPTRLVDTRYASGANSFLCKTSESRERSTITYTSVSRTMSSADQKNREVLRNLNQEGCICLFSFSLKILNSLQNVMQYKHAKNDDRTTRSICDY